MDLVEVGKDLVAGSVGGAAGIIAGQPLDVAKVRQQMASPGSLEARLSVVGVMLHVVRSEGPLALLKGVVPPVASQGAFTALSFAGFNASLLFLQGGEKVPVDKAAKSHQYIAGCVGGALTTIVTTPCELIKLNLQVDHARQTTANTVGGVRRIVTQRLVSGGPLGLYKGWAVTLLRDTPTTGLYFLIYYQLKALLLQRDTSRTVSELFAGGVAGVLSWGSVIPVDVVKTRVQTDQERVYRSALHCARTIHAQEGIQGLFKGAKPLLLRAFPVNAITFFAYERVYSWL
jgi:hypothetical protein